jgi:hypothetical protein
MDLLPWPLLVWVGLYFLSIPISHKKSQVNLGEANKALIALLDKIRRLDNDLIRIKSKLNTILTIREEQNKKNKD